MVEAWTAFGWSAAGVWNHKSFPLYGHTLFVNETGGYRIWKIDGRATNLDVRSDSPQATVLFDNLPGYPDNLMRGRDGRIWVGFALPRNAAADAIAPKPFMRKLILRLPHALWPLPKAYGHVFAFDESGALKDPKTAAAMAGVIEALLAFAGKLKVA